jgi:thioredoxin-like negative regulator of GroEL
MSYGSPGEAKNPNLDDLMRLGVRTAKAGNRDNARVIFQQVLDQDKRNEAAWLWMASLAENSVDRRRYLETVLQLNPDNQTAANQLASMDKAVKSSEGASIRLGIMILAVLVLALALVGAVVLIITSARR